MDSAIAKHCPELVAGERSGHTAVAEGNVLYVWGGYVSIADGEVFLPNDEVWFYDLERGVWEMCKMSGEVPPPMSGTCGCSLNGDMYIFGGCNDNGQTNQLYCVNLLDGKYSWRKVNHKSGSSPSPRDKLSCWVFNGRLIYFAGYGHKQFDDIGNNRSFLMDEASRVIFASGCNYVQRWMTSIGDGTMKSICLTQHRPVGVNHIPVVVPLTPGLPMPVQHLTTKDTYVEAE
ncbi:kelch domain-containing protein 1 [Salmo salar]|uniref:Kelch domain-containing protein 1 n=1 Tax=Salmo salar TaxID=8030 RepID=A0ABM3EFM7_SALSA|nr:kelch domain-containing protein 1-like [Salmo salar]